MPHMILWDPSLWNLMSPMCLWHHVHMPNTCPFYHSCVLTASSLCVAYTVQFSLYLWSYHSKSSQSLLSLKNVFISKCNDTFQENSPGIISIYNHWKHEFDSFTQKIFRYPLLLLIQKPTLPQDFKMLHCPEIVLPANWYSTNIRNKATCNSSTSRISSQ